MQDKESSLVKDNDVLATTVPLKKLVSADLSIC